jgi:hypothetical protein
MGVTRAASSSERSADILVCRIADFPVGKARKPPAWRVWLRSADKNVGDTADKNVCATGSAGRSLMQLWGVTTLNELKGWKFVRVARISDEESLFKPAGFR